MLNPTQLKALDDAAGQALACEKATGCPAALTVGQWALESGWGKYSPGNNCFGIKFYSGAYGMQKLATHEYVRGKEYENNLVFATFESLEKCFEKHTELLTSGAPYRMVWARYLVSKDPEQLVRDMAPIYATDPHYADSVLAVMHMADVQAAIMPSLISI